MPRFICPECRARVQKFRRKRQADGSWICSKCKLRGSKVEAELHVAQKERDQAAEKARESSLLLKEEKNKRLKLEDKITQRLCRGGRYKLEGLDAAIVPDGAAEAHTWRRRCSMHAPPTSCLVPRINLDEGSGVGRVWWWCGTGQWMKEDRKSTRLNSSHIEPSRMPSSA